VCAEDVCDLLKVQKNVADPVAHDLPVTSS
jgi:hypothetical protein